MKSLAKALKFMVTSQVTWLAAIERIPIPVFTQQTLSQHLLYARAWEHKDESDG